MPTPSPPLQEVTQLLVDWSSGNQAALDRLMSLVYTELRQLAHRYMRRERSGHTVCGRDGCRVPLPWTGDAPPRSVPWLPQPAGWKSCTAEAAAAVPASLLRLYRGVLRLRRINRV